MKKLIFSLLAFSLSTAASASDLVCLTSLLTQLSPQQAETYGLNLKSHSASLIKLEGGSARMRTVEEDLTLHPELSKKLLNGLFAGQSIADSLTASRIEERFIIKTEDIPKARSDYYKWELRDVKPEGIEYTTLTAYASKISLPVENNQNASAKIRFRKYYQHPAGVPINDENAQEIFPGFTVVELKISGVALGEDGALHAQTDSVFKPRAFVPDALVERLIKFKKSDFDNEVKMQNLISEIAAAAYAPNRFNDRAEVTRLIEAIFFFGKIRENILRLKTVISYNRDSFATTDRDGNQFQLTFDRNINIYGVKSTRFSNFQKYFRERPEYTVPPGQSYAELKSSHHAVSKMIPSYHEIFNNLLGLHIEGTDRSSGKYSLSQRMQEFQLNKALKLYEQNSINEKLTAQGIFFFLIKGTANLPTPPDRKGIVEQGEISIALPFVESNQPYRMIIDYRPYILDGERYAIYEKLSIINQAGQKVDFSEGKDIELPNDIRKSAPIRVVIGDQRLEFPSVILPRDVSIYKDFFQDFYTTYSKAEGNPREIEELYPITTAKQLNAYSFKMKAGNIAGYAWSRFHRVITQVLMIGAVSAGVTWLTFNWQQSATPDFTAVPPTPAIVQHTATPSQAQSLDGRDKFLILKGENGELLAIPVPTPKVQKETTPDSGPEVTAPAPEPDAGT